MNPLAAFNPTQAEEFWQLLTLHRLTKTGYVAFATYNSGKDWDALKTALESEPSLNTQVVHVPSGSIPSTDPNFLPTLRGFGQSRALVLLRVDLSCTDDGFKQFCGYLNFHREEIVALPHGVIVCSTEPSITEINHQAPDTFAVKRALLDFRGDTEEVWALYALLEAEQNSTMPNLGYIERLKKRIEYALRPYEESETEAASSLSSKRHNKPKL
jgi:hypothetical protein